MARPCNRQLQEASVFRSLPALTHTLHRAALSSRIVAAAGPRDDFFGDMAADMAAMDRLMERQMSFMDRQMSDMARQMDAEMGSVMRGVRRTEADIDRAVEQARAQAQASASSSAQSYQTELWGAQPNVQIRRSEERGSSSYRYYESISITSGGPRYYTVPAHAAGPSPLLFVAALLAGIYAALAAAFARNFHLTTYQDRARWWMALAWPLLLLFSPAYRAQFLAAVRGLRVGTKQEGQPPSS